MIRQRLPQKATLDRSQPRDLFQTPNYAVDLLYPFIPLGTDDIWECAAGEGRIVQRLRHYGYNVFPSDIRPGLPHVVEMNFLNVKEAFNTIITNPPYSLKVQFFKKCVEFNVPFALLISGDYSLWTIDAVRKYGCEKIVPDHRIDYITPTGLSGANGHSSYFHSYWLTRYFGLGQSETFVELTKEMKRNI